MGNPNEPPPSEPQKKPPQFALVALHHLLLHPVAFWFLMTVSIWIFIIPKSFAAVPIYIVIIMLMLIPALGYRYIQNRKKPSSWFRRISWAVFPILAVLYVIVFSDPYFENHIRANEAISTLLMVTWFSIVLIPSIAWMVIASAAKYRQSGKREDDSRRATFYFFTIMMGVVVISSTETALDWRPAFSFGLICFSILFIADYLSSLGLGRAIFSSRMKKLSQQISLNILVVLSLLALVIALVVFLIYVPENSLTRSVIGSLLGVGFLLMLYQGYMYFKDWREQRRDEQIELDIAQGTDLPEQYQIGDDGEIVDIQKPRKHHKNPHQR